MNFINLPTYLPGRTNTDDFIRFKWDSRMNPSLYSVVVQSQDTSNTPYRLLGPLKEVIKLPVVHFNAESRLGVIPTNPNPGLPRYWDIMNRSSTYEIPFTTVPGDYRLVHHGVRTSAVPGFLHGHHKI